jgi:hypothetical protein
MGQINLPSNLLDRIKRAEQQISDLWKSVGLSSASIAAGGLTLLNSAYLKMLGATGNELLYIGPDGAGHQVVRIKDAAGNILFGSISGATSAGNRVAINPNPSGNPRIELHDDDNTSDQVSLAMTAGQYVMQREAIAGHAIDGGKVSFYAGNSFFGHQLTATGADSYLQFADDESIVLRGKWSTGQTLGGHCALHIGGFTTSAGPVAATHSYGATMADSMHPIVTLQGDFADRYWAVTASSSTGFTVGISTGSGNIIHFWAVRATS